MNLQAIADAIAARFVGVTATAGALTYSLKSTPTASLPNSIGKGPALLVFLPTGQLDMGVGRRRDDHYDFPVRLLTDPLDYPRRTDALYAWAQALRDKVEAQSTLGLSYVAWAKPIAMRLELDAIDYAGVTFDLVELTVRVLVMETVATVAA